MLTFLLSLALLLGASALTITEADAKENKKKEISAAINFRVVIAKVFGGDANKRGFGRILFTSASNDTTTRIDGGGDAFFNVITEMMGTDDRTIISAKVIVDAQKGVYTGEALGRLESVSISDRGVDEDGKSWLEGAATFIFKIRQGNTTTVDPNTGEVVL